MDLISCIKANGIIYFVSTVGERYLGLSVSNLPPLYLMQIVGTCRTPTEETMASIDTLHLKYKNLKQSQLLHQQLPFSMLT